MFQSLLGHRPLQARIQIQEYRFQLPVVKLDVHLAALEAVGEAHPGGVRSKARPTLSSSA